MTPEQISALIPDQSSGKSARRLIKSRLWKEMASNSRLLWGKCRSKGTRDFHVIVETGRPFYYCNCSSRKRPCSHVLALYFMLGEGNEMIRVDSDVPEWALEIRPRMLAHGVSLPEESPEEAEARQEARMAKRAKRIEEMRAGLIALESLIIDLLRQGLARLPELPDAYWEEQSARLVDAKLGSLARRLRRVSRLIGTPGWHEIIMEEFGQLYLVIRGFEKLEDLPSNVQYELLTQSGMALRKNDVLEEPAISGTWLAAGIVNGEEEDLRFRRVWLYEPELARFALVLDFAYGDTPFDFEWESGQFYEANVHYYPAAYPQRVIVEEIKKTTADWPDWHSLKSWSELYAQTTQVMSSHPWITRMPVMVEAIPVFEKQNSWLLIDEENKALPLRGEADALWSLMAQSGGHPIPLLAEWDGKILEFVNTLKEE
ncbi:MAG: hypothetical protein GYB31_20275 [Bacteroidetes bacterium]|nr:hypothetical protein [Bacteroidota bacterium]